MTPLKPKGSSFAKATAAQDLDDACEDLDVGQFVARTGTFKLQPMTEGGATQHVKVFEFAIKFPDFNWKMLATAGDLAESGFSKTLYSSRHRRSWTIDYPNAFNLYRSYKHAVDDNNRMRQDVANLATAWTSNEPYKRHMLNAFSIAETNALMMWNYHHPERKHTKRSWRLELATQLLQAGRQNANDGDVRRGFGNCELRSVPNYRIWNAERNAWVAHRKKRVRAYCWACCSLLLCVPEICESACDHCSR